MPTAIVTGSGGLVGAATTRRLAVEGYDVVGIDNDLRATFFGTAASTASATTRLQADLENFTPADLDIRDADGVMHLFREHSTDLSLVVHTAAQPSHDWAAQDPQTDFGVNAVGTLNLLEAARAHAIDAPFVFCSTNKVYGDLANSLPLVELETRLELPEAHPWHDGIPTDMSIDRSMHSLFGVSKAAADLLVQEYGRYFEMPTVCFRGGCLTGPGHAGAQLHGFLSYLMKCAVTGEPYTVFGYQGKQVRDNIHAADVASAFVHFAARPQVAAVYNLGGGRDNSCSVLEAIELCEAISGRNVNYSIGDHARQGDHRWWVSDLAAFRSAYPEWGLTYDLPEMLREIHDAHRERWSAGIG